MFRLTCCFAFLLAASAFAADAPKKPAFTPAQVLDAELKLKKAAVAIHFATPPAPEREPWEVAELRRPPAFTPQPGVPRRGEAPIDVIAFPDDTSDEDLAKLLPLAKRLPGLKTIDLGRTSKLTGKGLRSLAEHLPSIEALFLDRTTITDADLAALSGLRALKWLELSSTTIGEPGIRALGDCPNLQSLMLTNNPTLTPAAVAALATLKPLREVRIYLSSNTVEMAKALAAASQLSELHAYPVNDDEAVHIGKMDGLTHLDVSSANWAQLVGSTSRFLGLVPLTAGISTSTLTDSGLESVAGCKMLETLVVDSPQVTVARTRSFASLDRLTTLTLKFTGTNDAGLGVIAKLKMLRRLDVAATSVTDAGLRELADAPRLQRLDLSSTRIGNDGLARLTRARSLEVLTMNGTLATAADLPDLADFARLKRLDLAATNVSPRSFESLARVRSLKYLDLRSNCPNVTHVSAAPLRQSLPECFIEASSCTETFAMGWPGAVGYSFRLPEFKSFVPRVPEPKLPTFMPPKTVITLTPKPPPPPPKVAPTVKLPTPGTTSPKP